MTKREVTEPCNHPKAVDFRDGKGMRCVVCDLKFVPAEPVDARCPTCSRFLETKCPVCGPVEAPDEPSASREWDDSPARFHCDECLDDRFIKASEVFPGGWYKMKPCPKCNPEKRPAEKERPCAICGGIQLANGVFHCPDCPESLENQVKRALNR